jgi:hypothetical protein
MCSLRISTDVFDKETLMIRDDNAAFNDLVVLNDSVFHIKRHALLLKILGPPMEQIKYPVLTNVKMRVSFVEILQMKREQRQDRPQ